MSELTKRLKKARKQIGLTLLDVSKKSGIRYSDLCRFERGTQTPKFFQLSKLAEIYKKSTDWFFEKGEIKEPLILFCKNE